MKVRIALVALVVLAAAGCVATPERSPVAPPAGAGSTAAGPTAARVAATLTPAALPTLGTPAATATPPPTVTTAPQATPGPYGHAADYSWLAGRFTVSGQCRKLEYDPAHADAHGGATYVTFSGVDAPANGAFVRVEGRFIDSERPQIAGCPESTYLVSKVGSPQ